LLKIAEQQLIRISDEFVEAINNPHPVRRRLAPRCRTMGLATAFGEARVQRVLRRPTPRPTNPVYAHRGRHSFTVICPEWR
jgi:hypothetical protein